GGRTCRRGGRPWPARGTAGDRGMCAATGRVRGAQVCLRAPKRDARPDGPRPGGLPKGRLPAVPVRRLAVESLRLGRGQPLHGAQRLPRDTPRGVASAPKDCIQDRSLTLPVGVPRMAAVIHATPTRTTI